MYLCINTLQFIYYVVHQEYNCFALTKLVTCYLEQWFPVAGERAGLYSSHTDMEPLASRDHLAYLSVCPP